MPCKILFECPTCKQLINGRSIQRHARVQHGGIVTDNAIRLARKRAKEGERITSLSPGWTIMRRRRAEPQTSPLRRRRAEP